MNMFAVGRGLAQQPSEFLLFQHFLIGLVLKNLYIHVPSLPWYGILLYLYLFLSSVIIGYSITRLNPRPFVFGLWITLLTLFYVPAIVSPQFTICAGFVGIAGLVLLYSNILKPHPSRTINAGLLVLASGLIILCSLIRYQAAILVAVLIVPLFAHLLVRHFAAVRRRLFLILSVVGLSCVALYIGQRAYYQNDPGWRQFHRYNEARAEFTDRDRVVWNEQTEPLFREIGWTQNDLDMLRNWIYLDRDRYSLDKLIFLLEKTPYVPQHKMAWRQSLDELKTSLLSCSGLGTLLLGLCLLVRGSWMVRVVVLFALVWYCGLFIGICIVQKSVPLRVWLGMLFGLGAMELLLWCQPREQPSEAGTKKRRDLRTKIAAWAVLSVMVALCWGVIRQARDLSRKNRVSQQSLKGDFARLRPQAGQLFVVMPGDFPYEAFQLPFNAAPIAREMQLLGLGVGNQEPFVQNRLKTFGIEDLYQAFYSREDVLLISTPRLNVLLVQYIQEHYNTKVEVRPIFEGRTFSVGQVKTTGITTGGIDKPNG
jgi:hypothetical protein